MSFIPMLINDSDVKEHNHTVSDITDISTNYAGKTHTHNTSDINGLSDTLSSMSSPTTKLKDITISSDITSPWYNIDLSDVDITKYNSIKLIIVLHNGSYTIGQSSIYINGEGDCTHYNGGYYISSGTCKAINDNSVSSIGINQSFYGRGKIELELYKNNTYYLQAWCMNNGLYYTLSGYYINKSYSEITKLILRASNLYSGTQIIVYGYE